MKALASILALVAAILTGIATGLGGLFRAEKARRKAAEADARRAADDLEKYADDAKHVSDVQAEIDRIHNRKNGGGLSLLIAAVGLGMVTSACCEKPVAVRYLQTPVPRLFTETPADADNITDVTGALSRCNDQITVYERWRRTR